MELICSTECLVFLIWWGEWPTSGLMMLANSLATPYVTAPLLETMSLRGAIFMDLGDSIEFGRESTGGIKSFVGIVT